MFSSWTAYGFGGGTSGGGGVTPSLQQVTDVGNITSNEIIVENALISNVITGEGGGYLVFGEGAVSGASGFSFSYGCVGIGTSVFAGATNLSMVTAVGSSAAYQNSGDSLAAFGVYAGGNNSGSGVTIIGNYSNYSSNSGSNVIAIGQDALVSNTEGLIIVMGSFATAPLVSDVTAIGWNINTNHGSNNIFSISPSGFYQANFSLGGLNADRMYNLPNVDGTLMVNPMNTQGDIVYRGATIAPVRLPIGSNGNFLTVSSGIPAWSALPVASAVQSGVVDTGTQTFVGGKTFNNFTVLAGGFQSSATTTNANLAVTTGVNLTPVTIALEGSTTTQMKLSTLASSGATLTANNSYATYLLGSIPISEAATGTHPLIAGIAIKAGALTDAGGTVTNTATLYIEGAWGGTAVPTGGAYAIWSKAGLNRMGSGLILDSTATTGIQLFNTSAQVTNTETLEVKWAANLASIGTVRAGTGTARVFRMYADSRSFDISPTNVTTGKWLFAHGGGDSVAGSVGTAVNYQVSAASGIQSLSAIWPSVAQSGTAGYRGLWISSFESSVGSGSKFLIDAGTSTAVSGTGTYNSKFSAASSGQVIINGTAATISSPAATAILQIESTSQGVLFPRMTMTQRDAIVSPETSLMIFQTDNTPGFYWYNGAAWTAL